MYSPTMNKYFKNNAKPVTEAYFGKTKDLAEAERALAKLVDIVRACKRNTKGVPTQLRDHMSYASAMQKILHEPAGLQLIHQIEESFKKQFGFKKFVLRISREFALMGPNAFTVQGVISYIGSSGIKNPLPVKQNNKYYDSNHEYMCVVYITGALLGMTDLSADELMGLILHEVGHNFQCSPLANIGHICPLLELYQTLSIAAKIPTVLTVWNAMFTAVTAFFGNEFFIKLAELFAKMDNDTPKQNRKMTDIMLYGTIKNMLHIVNAIPFFQVFFLAKSTTNMLLYPSIISLFVGVCGYSGEVFADSFAAAYGYGAGLSSALMKIERTVFVDYNDLLKSKTPISIIYEISALTYEIMVCMYNLDPHPSTQKRILNTIDKLESEVKSGDLPPELKKKALEDLKYNRKVYEDFLQAGDDVNKLVIISAFRRLNDRINGNLDFRSFINKVLNVGFDKV